MELHQPNPDIVSALCHALGHEKVVSDADTLSDSMKNTIGVERTIPCIVYPTTTSDVSTVIHVANQYKAPIYPVSRGKNTGYGDRLPIHNGQILVDLSGMNRIREFDNELGTIVLEPGVTQEQLHQYLIDQNACFCMDVTGAGLDSSIVGNTLEGGFGHTPQGNRRKNISNLEVVCGNGEIVNTGEMLDFGPNLSGLFIQSNFGVVTALKTRLMRRPDFYKSFMIKVYRDESLELLIDRLRDLRQDQTLTSLVHIANAVRSFISTQNFPAELENTILTCGQAMDMMSSPFLKVGYWTVIGGLYGSKKEIRAKENRLKRSMKGIGSVGTFDEQKIKGLSRLVRFNKQITKSLDALKYTHELGMGVPNDTQLRNIKWRVKRHEDMGLRWFSPKVPATGENVRKIITTADRLYQKYKFEFPITLTLVTPENVTGVLSISFNKNDPEDKGRAESLYKELQLKLGAQNIFSYRYGIDGMAELRHPSQGKNNTLRVIKKALDPNNIIAPGRYGL